MAETNGTAPGAPAAEPALADYLSSPNAVFADRDAVWRYGKPPDYSKTRKVWEEGKKSNHAPGSLEQIVENLVKNWEVEASFKPRLQDWRTVDQEKYTFAMGGGPPQSGEHMLKVGTYNAIIEPNEYYDPNHSDFDSSHKTFKRMMPTFAWEVVEVYSGPPVVTFKWRHWGQMKNDYVGFNNKGEKVMAKAHGGSIEIFGVTVAKVDDKIRVQSLDTWMDPLAMFRQIAPYGVINQEPMNKKVDKPTALDVGSGNYDIKVAEAHQNGHTATNGDQVPGADIPKHISETTGLSTDAAPQEMSGCPFMAQNGGRSHTNVPDGHTDIQIHAEHPAVSFNNNLPLSNESQVRETMTPIESDASIQAHAGSSEATMDDAGSRERNMDVIGVAPQIQSKSNGHTTMTNSLAVSTTLDEEHGTAMAIDQQPENDAIVSDANSTAMAIDPQPQNAAKLYNGNTTPMAVDSHQQKRPAEEDIPRSFYSSAITGDVEDVINAARSDDYVDESQSADVYNTVNQHLQMSPSHVYPHPNNMEKSVKPDPGEAIAVPTDSGKAQKTFEEMSEIKPGEKELLMNRE